MNPVLKNALAVAAAVSATHAVAQVTFYGHDGFEGRSFTIQRQVGDLERYGFNDRASSVVVLNDRWEVCADAHYSGHRVVLRAGRYPSLAAMGMNDRLSSVRAVSGNVRVDDARYAPPPAPVYGNHRRDNDGLYEANVTSVHAVVGSVEQRCWIEHQQVAQERSGANVPGAIVGALLGGVLGHQVGGGRGKKIATAGGAVAGAAVGASVGRNGGQQVRTEDVQRCDSTPSQSQPEYWDVTYDFRGQAHRVQMTSHPGSTVTSNRNSEPRA